MGPTAVCIGGAALVIPAEATAKLHKPRKDDPGIPGRVVPSRTCCLKIGHIVRWICLSVLHATAIARVSGKPPVGTWLNLPLEGSAVRVIGAV